LATGIPWDTSPIVIHIVIQIVIAPLPGLPREVDHDLVYDLDYENCRELDGTRNADWGPTKSDAHSLENAVQ